MTPNETIAKADRLSNKTILAFALPAIPIAGLGLPITVYLPPFYAENTGLTLGIIGTIFLVARFWDVFTDPVLGILSDKYDSRWGRRRHWMVMSVPILMISVYMLFVPPDTGEPIGAWYMIGWLIVMYVGWTLITISHMAWGAELSPDYNERSRIQGWREFALIFGMFTVLALPAILEVQDVFFGGEPVSETSSAEAPSPAVPDAGPEGEAPPAADSTANAAAATEASGEGNSAIGRDKVTAMGWFIVLLMPITVAIAVFAVPERSSVKTQPIPWRKTFSLIRENKALRMLLVADLLAGFAPAVTGATYIWYIAFFAGWPQWSSVILLCYFIAAFAGIPFWIRLAHKVGKHKAFSVAMFYGAAIMPLFFFGPWVPLWSIFVVTVLYGIAYGAGPFLLRAIMADVCDMDRLETGQERTGLYYSLLTMTAKVAAALGIGVSYALLDWIGFDAAKGADNSPEALWGLLTVYMVLPCIAMFAVAVQMRKFPLDRETQADLRRRLEEVHHHPEPGLGSPTAADIIGDTEMFGEHPRSGKPAE